MEKETETHLYSNHIQTPLIANNLRITTLDICPKPIPNTNQFSFSQTQTDITPE